MREFNQFQTQLPEEVMKIMPKEVKRDLLEAVDSIEFVKNLTSKDRKRARDLERWDDPFMPLTHPDPAQILRKKDPNGRIIVDITNPHYLEDMDYFREAAIHFNKNGVYTMLIPNKNPNSEYQKFWKREAVRCRDGMVRESDGEWIPGYFYFYLNYSPILKVSSKAGSKMADRIEGFPNVYDGDYLFYHYLEMARQSGKHTATLKKRGSGFSFKGGSKMARNFILGETEVSRNKIKSYAIANEKEYLTKDGVLNKFLAIADFNAINATGFPGNRSLKDSMNDMTWKMGRKDVKTGTDIGTLNEVMGVTLKNDPEKARGKRGSLIEWEEAGKFDNFLTAWGIARPSVEEDGFAFGLMNAYGTGGTKGVAFDGLEEIFYNSSGYNILEIPNVFDANTHGKGKCAFFFGTYLNMKGFYDHDGNSDVIGALIYAVKDRIQTKYGASDPNAIVQKKAEHPITPQEAIMRSEGSAYPVADLRDLLEDIAPKKDRFLGEHWVGELGYNTKGFLEWKSNPDLTPIRDWPFNVRGGRSDGAIEIFEMPQKGREGHVFDGRYIAGIDPIDNDYTIGGSLASIFIFDLWTDKIVAEYSGRPVLADEFYETCLRMITFYNAVANYENNLKGLFFYFNNKNALHLLCDTPDILRDMDIVKSVMHGNRSKGTRTTAEVIKLGKTLQRSWMLQQIEVDVIDESDPEGVVTQFIPNLRRIRSLGYIKEAIGWNPDGNFDRCSAMDMVMILREDRAKMVDKYEERENEAPSLVGDEFIDLNWTHAMGALDGNDKANEPWYIGRDDDINIDDPIVHGRAISDFDI